jgi:hypothetical protein
MVALDRMLSLTGSGTLNKPHVNSEAMVELQENQNSGSR